MKAYKGFDKDLKCRGYQFKEGSIHKEPEANCVKNGFHCAEDPLDCLSYYPNWNNSVYYIVEASGDIHEDGSDSKISCTELKLLKKLTIEEFVAVSIRYIVQHPTRKWNSRVKKDEGIAESIFAIVRGKNPIASGKLGTVLGYVKEFKKGNLIESISVFVVDGINFFPGVWYDVEGKKVDYEKRAAVKTKKA